MDSTVVKSRPLSRVETRALINLIEKSKIIPNKTTNATYNKLKLLEWTKICRKFNATAATVPRTPQQLRLKWENLKKGARKRNIKIRMNIESGAVSYIPPDENLDRVINLLDSFNVLYSGDNDITVKVERCGGASAGVASDSGASGGLDEESFSDGDVEVSIEDPAQAEFVDIKYVPIHSTSSSNDISMLPSTVTSEISKKILQHDEVKQQEEADNNIRNTAITEYFQLKNSCLNDKLEKLALKKERDKLEIQKIKLENEKIILENEKLRLENKKLRLEIERL